MEKQFFTQQQRHLSEVGFDKASVVLLNPFAQAIIGTPLARQTMEANLRAGCSYEIVWMLGTVTAKHVRHTMWLIGKFVESLGHTVGKIAITSVQTPMTCQQTQRMLTAYADDVRGVRSVRFYQANKPSSGVLNTLLRHLCAFATPVFYFQHTANPIHGGLMVDDRRGSSAENAIAPATPLFLPPNHFSELHQAMQDVFLWRREVM